MFDDLLSSWNSSLFNDVFIRGGGFDEETLTNLSNLHALSSQVHVSYGVGSIFGCEPSSIFCCFLNDSCLITCFSFDVLKDEKLFLPTSIFNGTSIGIGIVK